MTWQVVAEVTQRVAQEVGSTLRGLGMQRAGGGGFQDGGWRTGGSCPPVCPCPKRQGRS